MGHVDIGQLVTSRAGRDCSRKYLVVEVLDDSYVAVADGHFRKAEAPKRKNLKHLIVHPKVACEVQRDIREKGRASNRRLSAAIREFEASDGQGREEGSQGNGKGRRD